MKINSRITWLAAAFVLVSTGCRNSPWEPTPVLTLTLQVQGTVTDAETGAPLFGVEIALEAISTISMTYYVVGEKVYTDNQGKYLVTGRVKCSSISLWYHLGGYSGGSFFDRVNCTEDLQTINFTMKKVTLPTCL